MVSKNSLSILASIVSIIILVLFYIPFKNIQIHGYGIVIGKYSRVIDKKNLYLSGKHFVGYTSNYINISKRILIVTYKKSEKGDEEIKGTRFFLPEIEAKTKESSTITITCSIMFKYIPGEFGNLLEKWLDPNKHLGDAFKGARNTIILAINRFSYEEIITDRFEFEKYTSYRLSQVFIKDYFIELQLFLLDDIILENRIEDQFLNNLTLLQNQKTEQINNKIKDLDGSILSIESDGDTEVQNINRNAEIKASIEVNKIKNQGVNNYYSKFLPILNIINSKFSNKDYYLANLNLLEVI